MAFLCEHIFLSCNKIHKKLTILIILKCTVQDHLYIPSVVQLSLLSSPRTFLPADKETACPLSSHVLSLPPLQSPLHFPSLVALFCTEANVHVPVNMSCRWNRVSRSLLWLLSPSMFSRFIQRRITYLHSLSRAD